MDFILKAVLIYTTQSRKLYLSNVNYSTDLSNANYNTAHRDWSVKCLEQITPFVTTYLLNTDISA